MRERPELTCQELVEAVTDYLEGALSEAEREALERHLDECPGCIAFLRQMRITIDALGTL